MFHKQKKECIGRYELVKLWRSKQKTRQIDQYEQLRFYPMRKNNPYYKLIAVLEFIPLFNL